jgi:hypothetical protein
VEALDPEPIYTHTLHNYLEMEKFGIEFHVVLTLSDGSWVHRPRNQRIDLTNPLLVRKIHMQTKFKIELTDLFLDVDILALLSIDRLVDKYIGSIFGAWPDGSLTKRMHCAAYGLELMQIPRLQVSGNLNKLKLDDFFGDLTTLVEEGTKILEQGYLQATNTYLRFLADAWVRPRINDVSSFYYFGVI